MASRYSRQRPLTAQEKLLRKRFPTGPWTPWAPEAPAPGTYDPALDSALGSSARGFADLQSDTGRNDQRALADLGLAQEQVGLQRDRGFADIDRNLGLLTKRYEGLGRSQLQQGNKAGIVSGSSLLAAAAAKRAANQAQDRQPLETSRTRLGEDSSLNLANLALQYTRGVSDRGTALDRARRENQQFGLDTNQSVLFSAKQGGWDPGQAPANEHTATKATRGLQAGQTYRTVTIGKRKARVAQNGAFISWV